MLIDPRTNLPFYIGKGKNHRVNNHYRIVKNGGSTSNSHKDNIIKKLIRLDLKPITKILHEHLSEDIAYDLETLEIKKYGITKDGGILTNCDYGGRTGATHFGPANGMYGKKHTDEAKAKISQALTGLQLGKTYEEIYGKDEAERLKKDRSVKLSKPKSESHKIKCKQNGLKGAQASKERNAGKSLEELYDQETASRMRIILLKNSNTSKVKYKVFNEHEEKIFDNRNDVCRLLNISKETFNRRRKDQKPINGWTIIKL
jgi:hypothetical protein